MVKYVYDAWGNHTVTDASGMVITSDTHIGNLNPFRYRSYYFDPETNLYFLQTRYYDAEIGRFINADDVSYLDPEHVNGLNLYAYCGNNPVMYTDRTGHWFGLDDLIAFLVGGIAGAVGQLIGDLVDLAITGEWHGTWESYVGAFIGYGIGAVTTLYAGPVVGFAVGGGLSTFIGQGLEKLTGTNNRSWGKILLNTGISAAIGALTGAFSKGLKIPGISAGRNSWGAVFKSGLTKIGNGTAARMSIKVFLKGLGSTIISRKIVGNIGKGIIKGLKEWFEYLFYGDSKGLGYV